MGHLTFLPYTPGSLIYLARDDQTARLRTFAVGFKDEVGAWIYRFTTASFIFRIEIIPHITSWWEIVSGHKDMSWDVRSLDEHVQNHKDVKTLLVVGPPEQIKKCAAAMDFHWKFKDNA